jgi:undecaprenyl diphosphate synthase
MNFSKKIIKISTLLFSLNKKLVQKLFEKSANKKIPSHIAIIMDGNARWAKKKLLPTSFGHKTGSENVKKIVQNCIELKVKYLTIYAFSAENWLRPAEEVSYLMELLDEYLENEAQSLIEKDVKMLVSGDLEGLSEKTRQKIINLENSSKNNQAITLNICFSYGSRQEIIRACKKIAQDILDKKIDQNSIDEKIFSQNLYQNEIPDPDLIIRTAGEKRLSNFLLWQAAYSELYFTDKFWPSFNRNDLIKAIIDFNKRERRYGKR